MVQRIKLATHLIASNGLRWFLLYLLESLTASVTPYFHKKRISFETQRMLPGFNTVGYNLKEWSQYDWSKGGEEWTESQQWKTSIIENFIDVYCEKGTSGLEIGPGGGRWSQVLAERCKKLAMVDLTEQSIEECKRRLSKYTNCHYYVNDGTDLSFLDDETIDFLWSFDVFVHVAPADIEKYIKQFARILKKDSIGVLHHATHGSSKAGFRSSLTNDLLLQFLKKNNFQVVVQKRCWGSKEIHCLSENDILTVFKKI